MSLENFSEYKEEIDYKQGKIEYLVYISHDKRRKVFIEESEAHEFLMLVSQPIMFALITPQTFLWS